jgi:adenylate kinase
MRVAVTGTPGTGKTTAVELVETDLDAVHLNDLVRSAGLTAGHDDERDSAVADLEAVTDRLDGREDLLVESHLAHHLPADRVVVLRCHPETVEKRLRDRGESAASAAENAVAEALGVVLTEAVEAHGEGAVYEIETTDATPAETASAIEAVVAGERDPAVGTVSYLDYLGPQR